MKANKPGCRVLLLTPPRGIWKGSVEKPWNSTQPLGLAYVAAAARDAGFPVKVLDAYSLGLPAEAIREELKSYRPSVVGISSLTPQWPDAAKIAEMVKQISPETLTVVGGPHVTALPEDAAGHPGVDLAVVGEGEAAIREICETVAGGGDLQKVSGVVIGMNGSLKWTDPRPALTELDKLSFPAHDLLPGHDFYNPFPSWGKKGNFSCIISGRGCPYGCSFCDVTSQQGKQYRLRSAENVVDEISWLHDEYGVTMFSFRDPSMICNRRRLLEICRLIEERGLDIVWTCNARANEVDPEMLAVMYKAGCRRMQYGIEVGNAEMLKKIKKTTREKVAEAVRDTRLAGISAHGYFIMGFLEDTPETIEETSAFARALDLDSASFAVMVPFPGTEEYEKYRREGLILTEDWRDYDVMGRPVYRHKNLADEDLYKATHRAYRRFYLRPRIIARHLRKMTSVWALREYLHAAKQVFR